MQLTPFSLVCEVVGVPGPFFAGSCWHEEGKGHSWQRSYTGAKAAGARGRAPCTAGQGSAATEESLRSLSLAGVTSSASERKTLLEEGNRVLSVEVSKPSGGNLFYSHVARSQTVHRCPCSKKSKRQHLPVVLFSFHFCHVTKQPC